MDSFDLNRKEEETDMYQGERKMEDRNLNRLRLDFTRTVDVSEPKFLEFEEVLKT